MKAILLISHGSHSSQMLEEVKELADCIKKKTGVRILNIAFAGVGNPTVDVGLKTCVSQGADEIFVLLNFLNSGKHVDEVIPDFINRARSQFPDVRISVFPPIGLHPRFPELFIDLISSKIR